MKNSLNTLLLGLFLIGFSSLNGYTQTVFDAAKCYRIVNKVSGKSLEIKDSSSAEGAVIFQWATVTGKTNQLWQVKKLADGRYSFVSKSSGKLIDAPDCTEGGVIKQYASDGTDSQKWRFDVQTDGSYKLFNTSCQKYLRLESGSAADGASVGIKNDFGTDAFKWLIQEAACSSSNTATASIKDVFIYADNNNDTHYNAGDSPISGVTVTLTNASNQIVVTAISAIDGSYSFLNLAAGNYTLTFPVTLADGKTITTRNPISVTLTAGQVFTSASAGYFKSTNGLGSIKNVFVFVDYNYNGLYDSSVDLPISGVTITLTKTNGEVVGTRVSDSKGAYSFLDLPAGTYILKFPEVLPDGKKITSSSSITVNLAAGQAYNNGDAGYFIKSMLPNYIPNIIVFTDKNNTGIYDNGDAELAGVTVTLLNANNQVYQTYVSTVSDGTPFYGLPSGTYTVKFPPTLPDGKKLITPNASMTFNLTGGTSVPMLTVGYYDPNPPAPLLANIKDVFLYNDNNNDGKYNVGDTPIAGVTVTLGNNFGQNIATTITSSNGSYSFLNLPKGTYFVSFPPGLSSGKKLTTPNAILAELAEGQTFSQADAGYVKSLVGSIGGFVFADKNNNDIFDAGDLPIQGQTITLTKNDNTIFSYRTTVKTNSSGRYVFPDLPDGSYFLQFPWSAGDYGRMRSNNASFSISAGQIVTNIDAAYAKKYATTVTGIAFFDNNNNQVYDTGDSPLSGLLITLGGYGDTLRTVLSDSQGKYSFLNVGGGFLKFPQLTEQGKWLVTEPEVAINVNGQATTIVNVGYSPLGTISGMVTKGRGGISIDTIKLYNSNNQLVATTRSDWTDGYLFKNLAAGTYTLKFPPKYVDTWAPYEEWSTVRPSDVITITLAKGEDRKGVNVDYEPTRLTAGIGLYFFYDADNDGLITSRKGYSESDVFGITATVTNNAGKVVKTIVSSTTNPTIFFNLPPDTYTVSYSPTLPNGSKISGVSIRGTRTGIGIASSQTVIAKVGLPTIFNVGYYLAPAVLSQTKAILELNTHAEPNRAQLQWINNTGSQNDFFTVEKQNTTTGDFDKLETVNSKATETNEVYTAYDNAVTEGDNTYRIALTLLDGTVKTSALKTVNFKGLNDIRIFPNPADEYINVDLRKYEGKTVALSVYNSVGLLVKKQTIEKVSAAPQQVDIQGFGTGSYLLRVQSEGKREMTRLFNIAK